MSANIQNKGIAPGPGHAITSVFLPGANLYKMSSKSLDNPILCLGTW